MPNIAWIVLGGAVGTGARYLVSEWMLHALGAGFPYGTLTVNLVGSFLIGLLFAIGSSSTVIGPTTMLALTTGFLGGFTTYSTFSLDTFKYFQHSAWASGAVYVAVTVVSCLVGTAAGFGMGQWLFVSHPPAP